MRRPHDNHRRFEVPATNGSRPLAGGRLCGGKVSELFRTGEWICRRGNRWREVLDRLLLFGWLLSQRDPIELSCEGVMRRSQVCKHQVCDHCGGRFGIAQAAKQVFVRFTPKADKRADVWRSPLSANRDLMHRNKQPGRSPRRRGQATCER